MSAQPPPPPPVPAPQPAATVSPPSPGPGKKWYLLPLLLLLLIAGPSVYSFTEGLEGIDQGLTRARVPGETEVSLERGTWTVFYEWQGEFEGQTFTNSNEFPGMEAVLITEDGNQIPIEASVGSFNYNIGGRSGFSVGKFDVPESGEYVLAARHLDPVATEEFVIALGKDIGRSTTLFVLGLMGIIAGGFFAFVSWLIIVILRSRAKKRQEMAAGGYAV